MAIPYAHRSRYAGTIAGLMQNKGDILARKFEGDANRQQQLYSGLGQLAGNTLLNYAQEKRDAPIIAAETKAREARTRGQDLQNEQSEMQMSDVRDTRALEGRVTDAMSQGSVLGVKRQQILKGLESDPKAFAMADEFFKRTDASYNRAAADSAIAVFSMPEEIRQDATLLAISDFIDQGRIPEKLGQKMIEAAKSSPEAANKILLGVIGQGDETQRKFAAEALKATAPDFMNVNGTVLNKTRLDENGNPTVAFQAPEKPETPSQIAARELAERKFIETQRHNRVTEGKSGESKAREWVMRPDASGKLVPMNVPVSEILPGDLPGSTRQQGRPVISGDANRLSDLDTSLSQAETLKNSMTTGTTSWMGATLVPDVVTSVTGIGAESKGQQGVINLVKQIIGKALEGGVLRKEDEIKYAKILPKLGDPPEVAQTKINNLLSTLRDKKENLMGSLEDANYDVTKFRQRQDSKASVPDKKTKDPLGIR